MKQPPIRRVPALPRFLRQHNVYLGIYPKIGAARRIAPHLDAGRNASHSFRVFCAGGDALLVPPVRGRAMRLRRP